MFPVLFLTASWQSVRQSTASQCRAVFRAGCRCFVALSFEFIATPVLSLGLEGSFTVSLACAPERTRLSRYGG